MLRHLYIESVPGRFMLNSVNAVGVYMVLVRCSCALLPVWETRCGGELVSPMGSQLLLRRHCDIESVPCLRTYCTVLFRYPIYFVPHKGAVGMASLYWIGPLFKFLWVMVRCRDVSLPVWEARCGGETVLMTVLSPQWDLQCCCVGIFGLWFDVEMHSWRYGGPAVEMSRS